jgi:hypothetical protein
MHVENSLAVFHVVETLAVRVAGSGSALGQEPAQLFHGFRTAVPRIIDDGVVVESK